MSKTYSIRKRLITWITIPVIVATILTLLVGFKFAWHEVEEVYDAQLVHSAKVLLQLTQHEILEDEGFHLGVENSHLEHKYERNLGFRVWVDTDLITQSPNTLDFKNFEAPPGFSDHKFNGHTWRFFVYLDPVNQIQIETSERYDIRYELIEKIMLSLLAPSMVFIPLLFLIIWFGIRKVLKPVIKISADMNKRSAEDLSPIVNQDIADEISPLVKALNMLLGRIEDSFKREREFTDHAAHELRTPLAAMKTQAQVLLKKAKDMPECKDGLENLMASVDRATALVEQLLSLARLQNEEFPIQRLNFSECMHDVMDGIRSQAKTKNISLSVDITEDVFIKGHENSLIILLKNLLDNAVKYTPEGGEVSVSLTKEALSNIADTGTGIRNQDKEAVFERFKRADKSGQIGSGLGLSIVKWIADAHHVEIDLQDNNPKGLNVSIQWKAVK
ncbi:MAG: ATP-binding protein [Alphaproteobacteria bacterium]